MREVRPDFGAYGLLVGVALEVRRDRFARLVRRVLDEARQRGMTNADIANATGVPKSTFYRWRDSDWSRDPSGSHVRSFFDGLNVPVSVAYNALDWADPDIGAVQPDPPLDPEFREILRKLRDPNVDESEKQFLRESIKMLAARGGGPRAADRKRAG
jgi:transcriptional regulator with XRE-family HTH domain